MLFFCFLPSFFSFFCPSLVFVFLSCLISLLSFHAKNNIKILHLKDSSHQSLFCFIGFLFLLSLSNSLLLSLLSPLAPAHLTLPLFGVLFLGFVVIFLSCVGLCLLFLLVFCLQKKSEKGRVSPLSTLRPALQKLCFRTGWF